MMIHRSLLEVDRCTAEPELNQCSSCDKLAISVVEVTLNTTGRSLHDKNLLEEAFMRYLPAVINHYFPVSYFDDPVIAEQLGCDDRREVVASLAEELTRSYIDTSDLDDSQGDNTH